MKAISLIAGNFLREQRWFLVFLVGYVALVFGGIGAAIGGEHTDDVLALFWQQAGYAVFFSLFLAASAIHNDRKSRRILSVLSKAVTRRQYIAGMLLGVTGAIGLYYAIIAAVTLWLLRHAAHAPRLFATLGLLGLACLLVSALALFFSTFLPPLLAMVAAGAAIGASAALRAWIPGADPLPVVSLMEAVMDGRISRLWWGLPVIAAGEVVLLWFLAAWLFSRRDVAVAVE